VGFAWKAHSAEVSFREDRIDVVWNRRLHDPVIPAGRLDPEDEHVNAREMQAHARALWHAAAMEAIWLNTRSAQLRASSKLLQLRLAAGLGFPIPDTIVTNDPVGIRRFLDRHRGEAIHKTFGALGIGVGDSVKIFETARFTREDMPSDEIQSLTIGIVQQRISKGFDVRMAAFGGEFFCLGIESAHPGLDLLDWRNYPLKDIPTSIIEPPPQVREFCLRFMDELGIAFGAFDFVVDDEGRWVFIEVNESGQFLFMEEAQPDLMLLDGFCRWLMDPESRAREITGRQLRFGDILASRELRELMEADIRHVPPVRA
jgi:glutathione synthase/RimK-type ligase-like ATP-grasp enzyme